MSQIRVTVTVEEPRLYSSPEEIRSDNFVLSEGLARRSAVQDAAGELVTQMIRDLVYPASEPQPVDDLTPPEPGVELSDASEVPF